MVDKRPRFGLIGAGIWAHTVHALAAAQSQTVHLSSILARNEAAADELAAAYGAKPYVDLESFLDSVDIVGIALPPDVQPDFAMVAIAAGKHLLLEKPIATDPIAADNVAAAVEANGLASVVFFTQLLMPRVRAWMDEAATTGGWMGARVDSFSRVLVDPTNPFHATAWRGKCGALWDTGPHVVALLTKVLGEVEAVSATSGQGDLTSLTLSHSGGAISTINLTMDAPASLPSETIFYGTAGGRILPPSPNWNLEAVEAYGQALNALAAAVTGHAPAQLPDARFGAQVTKVLAAAERSIASGRRISLP